MNNNPSNKGDTNDIEFILRELVAERYFPVDKTADKLALIKSAKSKLEHLIAQETNKARMEMATGFIKKLDEANVPNEVKIPELVGDDLTRVSVPVVSGEYWVNIHKALKYMREATQAALTADKGQAALANVDTNQTQRYMDGFYSGKGQA